jgi:hypothetical protein
MNADFAVVIVKKILESIRVQPAQHKIAISSSLVSSRVIL